MKTQTLRIDGEIGSFWDGNGAKMIAQNIQNAELESGDTLEITINSVGGAVFEALGIIGSIKKARTEGINVVAKIEGLAASAASLIACACSEVVMAIGSMMMIHNVQGMSYGDHNQLREDADLIEKMSASISGIYTAKTGKSNDEILEMMNEDTWMDCKEAVLLGFADRVDDSFAMVACASLSMSGYNVPERFKNMTVETETETETTVIVTEKVTTTEEVEKPSEPEPVDPENIRRDAIIAERARVEAIKNMAPKGIDVSALLADGTSAQDAPAIILKMVQALAPIQAETELQAFRAGISAPEMFSNSVGGSVEIWNHYQSIQDPKERTAFFAQNQDVIKTFARNKQTQVQGA